MAVGQLSKAGIILLTVDVTADKVVTVSDTRAIEEGYITFATIGLQSLIVEPFQLWATLRLIRDEGLTGIFYGTICYGYISSSFGPFFTGRLPVFPGDSLVLSGISNTALSLFATVRFERQ